MGWKLPLSSTRWASERSTNSQALAAQCDAFLLNPLLIQNGRGVRAHIDRSLEFYKPGIGCPVAVSVLYVQVLIAVVLAAPGGLGGFLDLGVGPIGFALFLPWGLAPTGGGLLPLLAAVPLLALKLAIAGAGLALLETLSAKLRIFRAPEYLAMAFLLAMLGLLVRLLGPGPALPRPRRSGTRSVRPRRSRTRSSSTRTTSSPRSSSSKRSSKKAIP